MIITFFLYTYLYDQNFDPVCRTHESSHGLPVILYHRNWGIVAFGCCNIFLVKTLQGSASRSSMERNMHLVPPLPCRNQCKWIDLDWFQTCNYPNARPWNYWILFTWCSSHESWSTRALSLNRLCLTALLTTSRKLSK